jgi:hypothetical protein
MAAPKKARHNPASGPMQLALKPPPGSGQRKMMNENGKPVTHASEIATALYTYCNQRRIAEHNAASGPMQFGPGATAWIHQIKWRMRMAIG